MQKIYTILQMNEAIKEAIRGEFASYVWVCGEIQDYETKKNRKHIFFNLVQKDPDSDAILAQMGAVIFENTKSRIAATIKKSKTDFKLREDIEVKFLCRVDFYSKSGQCRLIVSDIDPVYTLGKIAQNRQRIINELKAKGIFENNKLLTIPRLPLKIGLITSASSAACHDFINELKMSGFGFKVLLCDSHMQGACVEGDIISALNILKKEDLDSVVITRGGGSTSDLSFFDNKIIAEAVALFPFALVSALGHQINTTITDMVANVSVKTPTKAADFFVEKVKECVYQLEYVTQQIEEQAGSFLENSRRDLKEKALEMNAKLPEYFRLHREDLLKKKHVIVSFLQKLESYAVNLQRIEKSLLPNVKKMLLFAQNNLNYIKKRVELLNPKNILKRGYSIVYKNEKIIKSIDDANRGDKIKIVLCDGSLISQVKEKE
ncbi:MAG: exodeoxyribonuclease VII large subunit [Candidatus Omnitrophica bacterium]|nr:exodeoxyribonuclease VII large subunit [Candidatus Omnitrophota bacterium]